MSQNPHAVKVKEEASRLRKRLAAAKKDAAEQEAKAKEQADLLAKLQANLDNITAGAAPQVQGLGSGAPHDILLKTYWVTAPLHKCVLCALTRAATPRAAQAALEEQVRTEAAEGELRLTDEQQAEFYRTQEEAGSRTAKLRADHAALQAAQARARAACRLAFSFGLQAQAVKATAVQSSA